MGRPMMKHSLRTAAAAFCAAALGASVAPPTMAARSSCTVTSTASSNVRAVDGYAEAVVDLAAFACGEDDLRTIPIEETEAAVASAMATAIAGVRAVCEGQGSGSSATVAGLSTARARATAVGEATASILGSAGVCSSCEGTLDAMTRLVRTVTAEAVAEARIPSTTFVFQDGEIQTFELNAAVTVVEENILEVLASVAGQLRASGQQGCSGNAEIQARIGPDLDDEEGGEMAECDVDFTAAGMVDEIDAVADVGINLQLTACESLASLSAAQLTQNTLSTAREVAVATARAVGSALVTCESNGQDSSACGFSRADARAVARAEARAVAQGIASVVDEECGCIINAGAIARDVETAVATTTAEVMAQACIDGPGSAFDDANSQTLEESLALAVAEVFVGALGDCRESNSVTVTSCAEAGRCVGIGAVCSTPDGMLPCCQESDVCTMLPGRDVYRCQSRGSVSRSPGAVTADCGRN